MFDKAAFFDLIRTTLFNGQMSPQQVEGIGYKLAGWVQFNPKADVRHIAYTLATAYHETGKRMWPIEEIGKGRGRAYGVPTGPWNLVYDGRGDVQLTWLRNYEFATKRCHELGLLDAHKDFVKNPELLLDPQYSAPVLIVGSSEGWFTGKKLGTYFDADTDDPVNARRIINGTDCAQAIAGYHAKFLAALKGAAK
jgi:putative chitinase